MQLVYAENKSAKNLAFRVYQSSWLVTATSNRKVTIFCVVPGKKAFQSAPLTEHTEFQCRIF